MILLSMILPASGWQDGKSTEGKSILGQTSCMRRFIGSGAEAGWAHPERENCLQIGVRKTREEYFS
jgi:hypothetical protein